MKKIISTALVCAIAAGAATAAHAETKCKSPMSEWQPQEKLQQKLEGQGWKVRRIKTEDGCYEAYALDEKGKRVEAYFDPKTFEMLKRKADD